MYQKYHTEAIVLGNPERGESDRVFTLYTEEFGLVRARASAVRSEKSRMRYALQNYSRAHVALVRGKHGWRIGGAVYTHRVRAAGYTGSGNHARKIALIHQPRNSRYPPLVGVLSLRNGALGIRARPRKDRTFASRDGLARPERTHERAAAPQAGGHSSDSGGGLATRRNIATVLGRRAASRDNVRPHGALVGTWARHSVLHRGGRGFRILFHHRPGCFSRLRREHRHLHIGSSTDIRRRPHAIAGRRHEPQSGASPACRPHHLVSSRDSVSDRSVDRPFEPAHFSRDDRGGGQGARDGFRDLCRERRERERERRPRASAYRYKGH